MGLQDLVLHPAILHPIGSGMAGLTAAAYLARDGHQVMVYEQYAEIGRWRISCWRRQSRGRTITEHMTDNK